MIFDRDRHGTAALPDAAYCMGSESFARSYRETESGGDFPHKSSCGMTVSDEALPQPSYTFSVSVGVEKSPDNAYRAVDAGLFRVYDEVVSVDGTPFVAGVIIIIIRASFVGLDDEIFSF